MNQEAINKDLANNDSQSSRWQQLVVKTVRDYMKASADKMSPLHTAWDNNSFIYRGYRIRDKEDRDAQKEGEPPKIIVPVTYAQIQTAISFILSTFTQRENIYELKGIGPEDDKNSFPMSMDLQYQLTHEKFILVLYFWLLDAWKQGFGVVRNEWKEKRTQMRVSKTVTDTSFLSSLGAMLGRTPGTKTVEAVESVLSYQGNSLRNVSPYAFYPDPSVNICDFQEGLFVGHEDETSFASLQTEEGETYFGLDKIPNSLNKDLMGERPRRITGPFNSDGQPKNPYTGKGAEAPRKIIRLEMEMTMSQKEASRVFQANFGSDTKPIKWIATVANDSKLIRFEPCGYLHSRYNYELFEFSPDHDAFFNPGLCDTIGELQDITTFFLNSHIVNVRKTIASRFIVDPTKIEMDDLKTGSIYIRTKGVQGDISRAIQQLQNSDITKSHVGDMDVIMSLIQVVSGVNENALGQYSGGRRSATEARNVNAGGAARLKMHATIAWLQGIEPLGRQFLANTRQFRTKDIYEAIVGELALERPYEQVILADPKLLAGGYDFVPYDATLPTDRQFQAQVLTELFTTLVQNPNTIQLLNKDPMKLLNHIAQLYNIRNMKDFDMQPLQPGASQDGPQVPMLPPQPQAQVMPNQQVADIAGAGAEPVDFAGEDLLRSLQES